MEKHKSGVSDASQKPSRGLNFKYQYLKVKKDKQEYLGIRYFKFCVDVDKVVQVCLSVGSDVKKGKANTMGVYMIHRMTLFSNYMAMNRLQTCTKSEFEKNFEKVINMLR
jgi:hypothetical protein